MSNQPISSSQGRSQGQEFSDWCPNSPYASFSQESQRSVDNKQRWSLLVSAIPGGTVGGDSLSNPNTHGNLGELFRSSMQAPVSQPPAISPLSNAVPGSSSSSSTQFLPPQVQVSNRRVIEISSSESEDSDDEKMLDVKKHIEKQAIGLEKFLQVNKGWFKPEDFKPGPGNEKMCKSLVLLEKKCTSVKHYRLVEQCSEIFNEMQKKDAQDAALIENAQGIYRVGTAYTQIGQYQVQLGFHKRVQLFFDRYPTLARKVADIAIRDPIKREQSEILISFREWKKRVGQRPNIGQSLPSSNQSSSPSLSSSMPPIVLDSSPQIPSQGVIETEDLLQDRDIEWLNQRTGGPTCIKKISKIDSNLKNGIETQTRVLEAFLRVRKNWFNAQDPKNFNPDDSEIKNLDEFKVVCRNIKYGQVTSPFSEKFGEWEKGDAIPQDLMESASGICRLAVALNKITKFQRGVSINSGPEGMPYFATKWPNLAYKVARILSPENPEKCAILEVPPPKRKNPQLSGSASKRRKVVVVSSSQTLPPSAVQTPPLLSVSTSSLPTLPSDDPFSDLFGDLGSPAVQAPSSPRSPPVQPSSSLRPKSFIELSKIQSAINLLKEAKNDLQKDEAKKKTKEALQSFKILKISNFTGLEAEICSFATKYNELCTALNIDSTFAKECPDVVEFFWGHSSFSSLVTLDEQSKVIQRILKKARNNS